MNGKDDPKNAKALRNYGMLSAALLMVLLGLMSSYLNDSIFYALESGAILFALLATCDLTGGMANELPDKPQQQHAQISAGKESIQSHAQQNH